jgi:hypothetical protein
MIITYPGLKGKITKLCLNLEGPIRIKGMPQQLKEYWKSILKIKMCQSVHALLRTVNLCSFDFHIKRNQHKNLLLYCSCRRELGFICPEAKYSVVN